MSRSSDCDYIYYNANMVNNNTSTGGLQLDPAVVFEDNRANPLIKDISKYELSVRSISINGALKNVPVMIPQIYLDPTTGTIIDVNRTINTITFSWSDGVNLFQNTQDIMWIPQNKESLPPQSGSRQQNLLNDYYYCYSYNHWCNLINNALMKAYEAVKVLATASSGFGGTLPPFVTFNKSSKTFSVYQDSKTSIVPYGQLLNYPYSQYQTELAKGVFSNTSITFDPMSLPADYNFITTIDSSKTQGFTAGAFVQCRSKSTGELAFGTVVSFTIDTLILNITSSTGDGSKPSADWSIIPNVFPSAGTYWPSEYSSVGFNTNFSGLISKLDATYYAKDNVIQGWNNVFEVYYPEYEVNVYPTNEQPFLGWYSGYSFDTSGSPALNTGALPNPFTSSIGITASTQIYICMTEEETSVDTLWSPIRSLVLSSTSIPTINENSSNPVDLGGQNLGYNQSSTSNFDFSLIEIQLDTNSLDYFNYTPQTEEYTSMTGSHDSLSKIQLSLWWRNRLNNQLYPVQLYNLGSVSVRLLFKMKSA